jgi:hypothetical protein
VAVFEVKPNDWLVLADSPKTAVLKDASDDVYTGVLVEAENWVTDMEEPVEDGIDLIELLPVWTEVCAPEITEAFESAAVVWDPYAVERLEYRTCVPETFVVVSPVKVCERGAVVNAVSENVIVKEPTTLFELWLMNSAVELTLLDIVGVPEIVAETKELWATDLVDGVSSNTKLLLIDNEKIPTLVTVVSMLKTE